MSAAGQRIIERGVESALYFGITEAFGNLFLVGSLGSLIVPPLIAGGVLYYARKSYNDWKSKKKMATKY